MKPLHASDGPAPSAAVVDQAIAWLVRLQSGHAQPADFEACQRWRAATPANAQAWDRLQHIQGRFSGLPAGPVARATLDGARQARGRRQALRLLSLAFVGGTTAWLVRPALPVESWLADHRTGTGERRRLQLPDGSVLWLDTQTAVDVRYSESGRRLVLHQGRIGLTTGADSGTPRHRPLTVDTEHGTVRALGTRFHVRQTGLGTQVQVFEHAVELQPRTAPAAPQRLQAGEQAWFDASGVRRTDGAAATPIGNDAEAWTDGLLVARDMPLRDFTAELARYRPGWLACDDEVAALRISGVFSLSDTERTLALVEKTLPVQVQRRTRYWVRLRRPA